MYLTSNFGQFEMEGLEFQLDLVTGRSLCWKLLLREGEGIAGPQHILGRPVEKLELVGTLFSVAYFSRGTPPPNKKEERRALLGGLASTREE